MIDLDQAVRRLQAGDWEAAHRIVQDDETPLACWAHGIVHLMEGDLANAGYWYRRAGRPLPDLSTRREAGARQAIAAEIAALRNQVPAPPRQL